jgi:Ni,Fe-hydrogenase III component G
MPDGEDSMKMWINNLDEVTHPFSIVAVKDTYNEYANKFLLYYDKAWKCWFFFSFHSQQENDEIHVKTKY